jgi:hypothetical protein
MAGKMRIDDVRFSPIVKGELNIEIVSGSKTYEFCITVGQARPIAAQAIALMDEWIADLHGPSQLRCVGH